MQAGSFSSGALLSSRSPEPLSLLCADERREIFITTKVPGGVLRTASGSGRASYTQVDDTRQRSMPIALMVD